MKGSEKTCAITFAFASVMKSLLSICRVRKLVPQDVDPGVSQALPCQFDEAELQSVPTFSSDAEVGEGEIKTLLTFWVFQ